MQTRTAVRLGLLSIFLCLAVAVSIPLAIHWWNGAHLPMTAERSAALCDNQSECYPEWGYLLGALGAFAACLALGLVIIALLWRVDLRVARQRRREPEERHMTCVREPFRLGQFAIVPCLVLIGSIAVAIHWLNEADLAVTAERYTALCNGQAECYPEAGYLAGVVLMGTIALFAGAYLLLLGMAGGVIRLGQKLTSR
jgi:hypothetical protein